MFKLRVISLFLSLVMIFTLTGSLAVFAQAADDVDLDTLSAGLDGYNISDSDFAALLSGTDVPSATDHISDYTTSVFNAKQHRLSMLVPELEGGFNINSTHADMKRFGYSLEEFLNYYDSYTGNTVSYLYSGSSENGSVMVSVMYSANNFTKLIGDYSKLSGEQLEDFRTAKLAFNGEYPELRVINGNTFFYSSGDDTEYGYYSYSLETIVKGGRYQIYIDLTNPSPADQAVAIEMVRSVKIGGLRASLTGAADSTLVTVMLVALCILFALVGLLTFFIIRFSKFSIAAGSKFNIIGFNMPPKKAELEQFAKQQKRAERKAKESSANVPKKDIDRSVSLTDSLGEDE